MTDCIFCKIAAGQIKAPVVLETPRVMAFRDINPQAPVHILIIPKKHITDVVSLSGEDLALLGDIHVAAQELAAREKLSSGFRLVVNNGREAGQSVDHLHYHLLGGRAMQWPPG